MKILNSLISKINSIIIPKPAIIEEKPLPTPPETLDPADISNIIIPPAKKRNKVNKAQALKLKTQHKLSYRAIAEIQHVVPSAIYQSIKGLLPDEDTETYKSNRADVFAKIQSEIVKTLNGKTINEAGLGERANAALKFHAAERLERGQASAIIGHGIALSESLQDAVDRIVSRLSPVDSPVDIIEANENKGIEG